MLEFAEISNAHTSSSALQRNQHIHHACRRSDIDQVRALLENGADVNTLSDRGTTPLSEALERGDGPLIELLLLSGGHLGVELAFSQ